MQALSETQDSELSVSGLILWPQALEISTQACFCSVWLLHGCTMWVCPLILFELIPIGSHLWLATRVNFGSSAFHISPTARCARAHLLIHMPIAR